MKSRNLKIQGPVGKTKPKSSVLPDHCSWLSLPIPKEVHTHVKHMASLSNMSLKEYVSVFLRTARPLTADDLSWATPQTPAHSSPTSSQDRGNLDH